MGDLLDDVRAGRLDPVYIITSDHPVLVERVVAALRDAVVAPAMRVFNYDVIEGKATASQVLGAARTLPMMGPRRMILIRDLAAMAAAELAELVPYLDAPNPSTVLVGLTSKLDKRMKLYAAAGKKGWIHELTAPRQIEPWIRGEIADRGARFEPRAIQRLADAVGADLSRIALAIDQLTLYAGERPVTADDVDDLIADTRERSVFELTDLIGAGKLGPAMAAASALCDQRQSAIGVIAMLARHMRQLALCHVGRAEGLGKGEMASRVGAPPFIVDRLTTQARRYTPGALIRATDALTQADRALKGMASSQKTLGRQLGERIVLEDLVAQLVALGGAAR